MFKCPVFFLFHPCYPPILCFQTFICFQHFEGSFHIYSKSRFPTCQLLTLSGTRLKVEGENFLGFFTFLATLRTTIVEFKTFLVSTSSLISLPTLYKKRQNLSKLQSIPQEKVIALQTQIILVSSCHQH